MSLPTVADALSVMDGLSIPCVQVAWGTGKAPKTFPYAVLVPQDARGLSVAGGAAHEYRTYDLQVYSAQRDVALEKRVLRALRGAGIRCPMPATAHDPNGPVQIAYFTVSLEEQEAENA